MIHLVDKEISYDLRVRDSKVIGKISWEYPLTYCADVGTIEHRLGVSLTLNPHSEISVNINTLNTNKKLQFEDFDGPLVMITKPISNFTGTILKVISFAEWDNDSRSYKTECLAPDNYSYFFTEDEYENI
jgi:hypothetical protein